MPGKSLPSNPRLERAIHLLLRKYVPLPRLPLSRTLDVDGLLALPRST